MEKEFKEIVFLYEEINSYKEEIENLEKKIYENNSKMIQYLKIFIKNWNPIYNEKATCINFADKSAYYVWFTGKFGNYLRFKEVPNEIKIINNYVRQEQIGVEDENSSWHSIVIPLEIFLELNKLLNFYVGDKSNIEKLL